MVDVEVAPLFSGFEDVAGLSEAEFSIFVIAWILKVPSWVRHGLKSIDVIFFDLDFAPPQGLMLLGISIVGSLVGTMSCKSHVMASCVLTSFEEVVGVLL